MQAFPYYITMIKKKNSYYGQQFIFFFSQWKKEVFCTGTISFHPTEIN